MLYFSHSKISMQKDSIAIPIAIVIAAGLIAGAIYMNGTRTASAPTPSDFGQNTDKPVIRQVEKGDHIRGNPNAPIMLVEYSDYECPFCKEYHETMSRIITEYGSTGKIAWTFRHFPIEGNHPNAAKIAEASECVAEFGGDPAFWKFTDIVFAEKPINDFTDFSRIPEFAVNAGVDKTAFETCFASGKYTTKVRASVDEAMAAGAQGTPHTLVLVGAESGVISGAQPYAEVKKIVENLIAQSNGGSLNRVAP